MNLDPQRNHHEGLVAPIVGAEAIQVQHIDGRTRPRLGELASAFSVPGPLADALHALAIARKRLIDAMLENESLRISNDKLMHTLDDAARLAVAAQRVAHHDRLTGLPNRLLLVKRLQLAIKSAAERHRQLALLFIDLDGFKVVNDRFGHMVADRLLSGVAARITACVRGDDVACRYGGDEFVVLLTNLDDAKCAVRIAAQIRERIGLPYSFDGNEICVTASIGLAAYPADGECYEVLLSCADASMYRDKVARRGHAEPRNLPGNASVEHLNR